MRSRGNVYTGVRDYQRSKVYRAERDAEGFGLGLLERLETVEEIQKWVNQIVTSDWFLSYRLPVSKTKLGSRTPRHRTSWIMVKDGRGRRAAGGCASTSMITMPKWSRYRSIILHEVAHAICAVRPWHGPAFTRVVLDLAYQFVGEEAAEAIREAYDNHGVEYLDCGYQEELEIHSHFKANPERYKRLPSHQTEAGDNDGPESLKSLLRF